MYSTPIDNKETLHQRIFEVCQKISNRLGTFGRVRQSMILRVHVYSGSGGRYFKHLLWTVTW